MNVCLNVSFDLFVLSHVSECFNSFSPGGRCTHLHVRPTCTAGPMRIKIPSSSLIPVGSSLRAKSIHQTHPRFHKIIIIITVFTYAAKVDTNNYLKPFIHVCTLLNEQTKEVHRRDVLSRTTGTFVQIFEKLFTTCLASRLNEHLSSLNPLASRHKWPANNS